MAASMDDQSSLFPPTTSPDTSDATSSQESDSGTSRSTSLDGAGQSGLAHVPANRSQAREKAGRSPTKEIYGRLGIGSSESRSLQQSLASRLMQRLDGAGSTEYAMTWKGRVTPSRRRYCQLAVSARRTSGTDCSGWPSPQAQEPGGTAEQELARKRRAVERGSSMGTEAITHLSHAAQMAGWPSPCTPNGGRSTSPEKMDATGKTADGRKHTASLEHAVKFATTGWVSPQKGDGDRGGQAKRYLEKTHAVRLLDQALTAGWATPTSRDHKDTGNLENVPVNALLGRQASLSTAATESGGGYRLNAGFSLWLQLGTGKSLAWLRCAPLATRSSRKSRRNSS